MEETTRVLLVDDDRLVVADILELIHWEELGFAVDYVYSGRAALQRMEEVSPEIFILDIAMPAMDGIALTREIFKRNPAAKILLLTAYSEFSYVQEALRLGVSNYILKHELDQATLRRELNKLCEAVKKERAHADTVLQTRFQVALRGAVFSPEPEDAGFYAAFALYGYQPGGNQQMPPQSLTGQQETKWLWSPMENGHTALLARWNEPLFGAMAINDAMASLRRMVTQALPAASMALSGMHKGIPAAVEALEALRGDMDKFYFLPAGSVYTQEQLLALKKVERPKKFSLPLSGNAAALIEEGITCMTVLDRGGFSRTLLQMHKMLGEFFLDPGRADAFLFNVQGCRYAAEVLKAFADQFAALPACNGQGSAADIRICRAVAYIQDHYGEELCLDEVAKKLKMSGGHLNRLFRKSLQTSFAQYVTRLRMERAKALLAEGHRVYEVAQMVGYNSSQYFSMAFHKTLGMNPSDVKP